MRKWQRARRQFTRRFLHVELLFWQPRLELVVHLRQRDARAVDVRDVLVAVSDLGDVDL